MDFYKPILVLCEVLSSFLNLGIIVLAVIEFWLAVKSGISLNKMKNKINQLNDPKVKRVKSLWKGKGKIETQLRNSTKNWSDLEEFLKVYQEKMKTYTAFTLIIQLFTLLGILGTVAGLFVAMQDMESAENLFDGVKFALSSTVLGIIFAVGYKVIDIILAACYVSHIDDGIEMYEKDYNINNSDAFHDMLHNMTDVVNKEKEVE